MTVKWFHEPLVTLLSFVDKLFLAYVWKYISVSRQVQVHWGEDRWSECVALQCELVFKFEHPHLNCTLFLRRHNATIKKSCLKFHLFNVLYCGSQSHYSCIVADARFEISRKDFTASCKSLKTISGLADDWFQILALEWGCSENKVTPFESLQVSSIKKLIVQHVIHWSK